MYVEPYYRIAPYLVGLLMGFLFHKTKGQLRLQWVSIRYIINTHADEHNGNKENYTKRL